MIPEIGKEYYFFDDGKISPSRCYKAKVLRVVPYEEEIMVDGYETYSDQIIPRRLQEIHKETVDDHRQSENFTVLNGSPTTPGTPWLYSEETDFFVECEIPGYDENKIWFARTIHGGWFSMNIQSSWQSGRLDVTGEIYLEAKKNIKDYDKQLKIKGELI